MRTWLFTIARLYWGTCMVLSSVYCLLAFLPYTYFELIRSPAYAWIPWFAHHQGMLFMGGLAGVLLAEWPTRRSAADFAVAGLLLGYGIFLLARPFLPRVEDDWRAYCWSLISLAPLIVVAGFAVARHWPKNQHRDAEPLLLPYSTAAAISMTAALLYVAGFLLHAYRDAHHVSLGWRDAELTAWSVISHVVVALVVFSILNLIFLGSRRLRQPATVVLTVIGLLGFALLWTILARFLNSAFSLRGWAAQTYAAALAIAITLWAGWISLPLASETRTHATPRALNRTITAMFAAGLSIFAVALPTLIGGGDWNGVLQGAFTLIFWAALGVCWCRLRPARARYSVAAILAVLVLSVFAYKALRVTEISWAKPLGSTDDEVARAMENYTAQDASFRLVHQILGNSREDRCDDFCRILSAYTNIRGAEAKTDLQLVDLLAAAPGARPNIFIFVIDSLRPDYLGAYNPSADFTPNLDAFAHDNVAVRNVYTQYAGTSLSEPTIWAGAMLPHAHYIQPFAKVNSLEKLARADGYRMMVSYDEVLSQLLSPSNDLVKLDTDKKLWTHLEVCSTIQQAEADLDAGLAKQPLLFYAQPKNVHQFAQNDMPARTERNWQIRPAFNNRIAYEVHQVDDCLGKFFSYLKTHQLYDDSIIIVTSDHGDATGEFGRSSHSLVIYPEIMRVPLLVHLPEAMRKTMVYDDTHISALTDITPSLYYLLGHRPIVHGAVLGHPLFVLRPEELKEYQRDELFMASDERAVYGLLTDGGRFLYTAYASPAESFLFDLDRDPNAQHNLLTTPLKQRYDEQLIEHLHALADFYGYKPGVGSLLASAQ